MLQTDGIRSENISSGVGRGRVEDRRFYNRLQKLAYLDQHHFLGPHRVLIKIGFKKMDDRYILPATSVSKSELLRVRFN